MFFVIGTVAGLVTLWESQLEHKSFAPGRAHAVWGLRLAYCVQTIADNNVAQFVIPLVLAFLCTITCNIVALVVSYARCRNCFFGSACYQASMASFPLMLSGAPVHI